MSTRSIIVLTGKNKTIRVYKHCDGYPTGNLPVIADAIKALGGNMKGAVKTVSKKLGIELTPDSLAEKILEVAELERDNLEETFDGPLKPKMLGNQGDLEWIYVVDVDAKTLNVYGGGWTGELPQVAFKQGTVDPLSYVKKLIPECQDREREETQVIMKQVEKLGFKLNPKKTKKLKGVKSQLSA